MQNSVNNEKAVLLSKVDLLKGMAAFKEKLNGAPSRVILTTGSSGDHDASSYARFISAAKKAALGAAVGLSLISAAKLVDSTRVQNVEQPPVAQQMVEGKKYATLDDLIDNLIKPASASELNQVLDQVKSAQSLSEIRQALQPDENGVYDLDAYGKHKDLLPDGEGVYNLDAYASYAGLNTNSPLQAKPEHGFSEVKLALQPDENGVYDLDAYGKYKDLLPDGDGVYDLDAYASYAAALKADSPFHADAEFDLDKFEPVQQVEVAIQAEATAVHAMIAEQSSAFDKQVQSLEQKIYNDNLALIKGQTFNAQELKPSLALIETTKRYERLRTKAYPDLGYDENGKPLGTITIGYGHTGVLPDGTELKLGLEITKEQADAIFLYDLEVHAQGVRDALAVPVTQEMFDALTDFTFNKGVDALKASTLMAKLNAGDYIAASDEFIKWNLITVNGQKVPHQGLTERADEQTTTFLSGWSDEARGLFLQNSKAMEQIYTNEAKRNQSQRTMPALVVNKNLTDQQITERLEKAVKYIASHNNIINAEKESIKNVLNEIKTISDSMAKQAVDELMQQSRFTPLDQVQASQNKILQMQVLENTQRPLKERLSRVEKVSEYYSRVQRTSDSVLNAFESSRGFYDKAIDFDSSYSVDNDLITALANLEVMKRYNESINHKELGVRNTLDPSAIDAMMHHLEQEREGVLLAYEQSLEQRQGSQMAMR